MYLYNGAAPMNKHAKTCNDLTNNFIKASWPELVAGTHANCIHLV